MVFDISPALCLPARGHKYHTDNVARYTTTIAARGDRPAWFADCALNTASTCCTGYSSHRVHKPHYNHQGIGSLLEAVRILIRQNRLLELPTIGDGPEPAALEKLVHELALDSYVHSWGGCRKLKSRRFSHRRTWWLCRRSVEKSLAWLWRRICCAV